MPFRSTKTYGHEAGLSACFRQWRADSHCSKLHGYALSVKLTFQADRLDERGWVIDFGGLKDVKAWLQDTFDHKTLVAEDDPELSLFRSLAAAGVADLKIVPGVGCENFSSMISDHVTGWLETAGHSPRVLLVDVEVREHGANSAMVVA